MAFALVNSVHAKGLNTTTSAAIDTTGANLLVVALSRQPFTSPTLTDSKGNTWTAAPNTASNVLGQTRFWFCINPTVGTGHTFTFTGSTIAINFTVMAFSGADTGESSYTAHSNATASNASTLQPGSITPPDDNSLVLAVMGGEGTTGVTVDSGLTELTDDAFSSGNYYALDVAYKIQTTAAAINPTFSSDKINSASIISFKAAAGGGGGDSNPPSVSVTSPTASAKVHGTISVVCTCSDVEGVTSLQLKVNGSNVGSPYTGTGLTGHTFSLDTTGYSDGNINIEVVASDGTNSTTSSAVTVQVDNTNPTGSGTAPTESEEISGNYEFTGSASDVTSGVKNAKLYIDGSLQTTDSSSPFAYTKNTSALSNGAHSYYWVIEDNAGNTYQTPTINFTVNNVEAPPAPSVVGFLWSKRQIVPVPDMLFWNALDEAEDATEIQDYSGNERNLTVASSAPVLQSDILNGQKAVYFDGTKNPLKFTENITLKHLFLIAAYDGATFTGNEGLISGVGAGSILLGNGAGTNKFANLGFGDFVYRKNDVQLIESNQLAPVAGNIQILELVFPAGYSLDGIQIGQDITNTGRKWKGWWFEQIGYGAVKSWFDRMRVYRYFASKFHLWRELADGTKIFPFPNNHQSPFTPLRYKIQSPPLPNGKIKTRVKGSKLQAFDFNYATRAQYEADAIDEFETDYFDGRVIAVENNSFYPPRRLNIIPTTDISVEPFSISLFGYKWSGRQSDTSVTEIDVNG